MAVFLAVGCHDIRIGPADFRLFIYLQNPIENATFGFAVKLSTFGRTHIALQTLGQTGIVDFFPHSAIIIFKGGNPKVEKLFAGSPRGAQW